jgi:hypothetical protein
MTCPACPHEPHRGHCPVETCSCRLSRPSLAPKPARPVVEVLPQDQRERDLAEVEARLRQAVVEQHFPEVLHICRALWDAGHTAEQRKGKP